MNEVTIVCCYNDTEQYNNFVDTLKAQSCPCEIIGIDNRGNKAFKSCAGAYNSVKDKITTKYVIYSHQDIRLTEHDTIAKFISYLERVNPDDILGVAGVRFDRPEVFTNIKHRWNDTGKISYASDYRIDGDMMECDTVDECFFGGYAEHFRHYPFDEVVCDNWHFYAADVCLRTKSKLRMGGGHNVYVCDVQLLHLSSGNHISSGKITQDFNHGFYKLCRKYSREFPVIATTCIRDQSDFSHSFRHSKYWPHIKRVMKYTGILWLIKKILR